MRLGHALLCCTLFALACTKPAPPPLRVAAAADLTDTFTELQPLFGEPVEFTFGASGLLSKQLQEGAPFDVFFSANAKFVDDAVAADACDAATVQPYARGRLALLGDLATAKRIALANPETAPYGLAARQALETQEKWPALQPRLVFTENVRQALQLYDTGNVEAALVAYANVNTRDGGVQLLDESLHAPITQTRVRCTRGKNPAAAQRFLDFLNTKAARDVLSRHGFR